MKLFRAFLFSFLIFIINSEFPFSKTNLDMKTNFLNLTQLSKFEKVEDNIEFEQYQLNFFASRSIELNAELYLKKKQKRATHERSNISTTCHKGADCRKSEDYRRCYCDAERGPSNAECSLNEMYDVPNCYCDEVCFEFNDCCYGFTKKNVSIDNDGLMVYKDHLECRIDIIPGGSSFLRGYWMVAKCPVTYTKEHVSTRCAARNKEDIPVTDSTGTVFWNAFCAVCHGSLIYKPWNVKLQVNNGRCYEVFPKDPFSNGDLLTLDVLTKLRNNSCRFTYMPLTNMKPRTCFTSLKISAEKQVCSQCQNHLKPIIVDSKHYYRNAFCVDYDRWNNAKLVSCFMNGFPYNEKSQIPPLTILFAVRQPQLENPGSCSSNFQFDSRTGMCFRRKCETTQCNSSIDDDVIIQNFAINTHMYLVSDDIIGVDDSGWTLTMFTTCLPIERFGLREKMNLAALARINALYTSPTHQHGDSIKSVINASFVFDVRIPTTTKEFRKLKAKINTMKFTIEKKSMSNKEEFRIWRVWNLSSVTDTNIDLKTWNFTRLLWSIYEYKHFLEEVENNDALPELEATPTECNTSLINIDYSNQTKNSKPRFRVLVNYTIEVSSEKGVKPSFEINLNASYEYEEFVKGILTYITLSISCGAILPTLIIHRYINLVSSIPGLISEQILVVLFLFNVCFISGGLVRPYQTVCFIISVISHFLLLSFFSWVSIFVCHTLQKLKTIRKINRNPFLKVPFPKKYFLIGYSIPFAIVLPSLILEVCNCTNINFGYTKSACFPTGYPENLVVVVAPVLLCLLIHLVCLACSAWYFYKVNRLIPDESMNTSKSYLSVYLRLGLISCLSWGLGVLSEALDANILRYLFIIFSGSHGLVFTLCIVTTKSFQQSFRNKMLTTDTPGPQQIEISMANNNENVPENCNNDSVQI